MNGRRKRRAVCRLTLGPSDNLCLEWRRLGGSLLLTGRNKGRDSELYCVSDVILFRSELEEIVVVNTEENHMPTLLTVFSHIKDNSYLSLTFGVS